MLLFGFAGSALCETADYRLFDDVGFGVASSSCPGAGDQPAGLFATARLRGETPWSFSSALAPAPAEPAPPRDDKRVQRKTLLLTGALFVALPIAGYFSWWQKAGREGFHPNSEGWFERDSYAGGSDKVSHFVFSYAVSRELSLGYERLGVSPARSRNLAAAVTTLAGALIELGDGPTEYGFSWEDIAVNGIGAFAASEVSRLGWTDLVGFRLGVVHNTIPPKENRAFAYGSDYSQEIYSADFKLAGAAARMNVRPGLARFLLLSVTYGSKGYRFSPVDHRERNVGLDVGINMLEVLSALRVPEESWWGLPLWKFFTYFRVPYTAFGYRYDMNHHRWHGPDTGDRFDPGKVIYQ